MSALAAAPSPVTEPQGATPSSSLSAAPHSGATRWRTLGVGLALLLILGLNVAFRWRLLDVPLERDEGEYAYAGQLLLRGYAPYERAYNMKMPGIYAAYAAILAIFGETHRGIHWGLLVISTATVLLMFFLGRRLFGDAIGLFSATAFGLHSAMQSVLGFTANAEHFVLLPALAGILVLLWAIDSDRAWPLLVTGVLLGIAFLMKQHGMFFGFFAGTYLLWHELRRRPVAWPRLVSRCMLLTLAALAPFGITCVLLWRVGVFDRFWFWTFDYATTYVTAVAPYKGLVWCLENWFDLAQPCYVLWALAFIGLDAGMRWDASTRAGRRFLLLFTLFSFLAICPGFWFREHYFILLLPAMSLAAGVGTAGLARVLSRRPHGFLFVVRYLLIAALALGTPVWIERDYCINWGTWPAELIARNNYGGNPTVEALELAEYLRERTEPNDTVGVLGSEPQIFFYADRRSASGHIYTYALMEDQPYALAMQEEMIAEIEAARPRYILYVNVRPSWLPNPRSEQHLFQWWSAYQRHYEQVGVVQLEWLSPGRYYWGEAVRHYPHEAKKPWIGIYQRREVAGPQGPGLPGW